MNKYILNNEGSVTMEIVIKEFIYLLAAAGAYLALLLIYNAVGGRKKSKKA